MPLIKLPGLLLLFALMVFAQEKTFTIHGYIEDAASGEKLIGANIHEPGLRLGASTNRYGHYSFTLPAGNHKIIISYIGYDSELREIMLDRDRELNIKLRQSLLRGDSIVVVADAMDRTGEQTAMSVIRIPVEKIKFLPALAGEVDLLKTIQLLPGVQSGSEGTSGIYVRGGGPDQNLIIIDDAPVYNAMHLFGFLSVFNTDAIKNVTLTKGGFPARYGGRLSSVVDIRMRDGNMKEFKGTATIGLIASRATWEGPLLDGKTSFIISGRRTYFDLLTRPLLKAGNEGDFGYYFYDFNAKVNHIFSATDRVYFSVYNGDDRFFSEYDRDSFDMGWGNLITTLRWNHVFNSKLFSNTTLLYSRYVFDINSDFQSGGESFSSRYYSGVRDVGLKADFDYVPTPRHYIRFGMNYTGHLFSPGAFTFKSESNGERQSGRLTDDGDISAGEAILYFEDEMKLSPVFSLNAGIHASLFRVGEKNYYSAQPRLSLRYAFRPEWSVKSSFVMMNQYIHLLSNSGVGLPTDLWLPATRRVPQQTAWQTALGLTHSMTDLGLELSFEGYYKKMDNLIEYKEGASFAGFQGSWEDKVERGGGESYGMEFFVEKKIGATSGWLGYTLSWSNRTFPGLNDGKTFPYRYDRRHDISLTVSHKFNSRWDMGLTWIYGTGNAITLPIGTFNLPNPDINHMPSVYSVDAREYTSRNGYRMPAYHRLDLSFSYHTSGNSIWTFSAYNAYNRQNTYFIFFNSDYDGSRLIKREARQFSIFPIIPSINYSFTF